MLKHVEKFLPFKTMKIEWQVFHGLTTIFQQVDQKIEIFIAKIFAKKLSFVNTKVIVMKYVVQNGHVINSLLQAVETMINYSFGILDIISININSASIQLQLKLFHGALINMVSLLQVVVVVIKQFVSGIFTLVKKQNVFKLIVKFAVWHLLKIQTNSYLLMDLLIMKFMSGNTRILKK